MKPKIEKIKYGMGGMLICIVIKIKITIPYNEIDIK